MQIHRRRHALPLLIAMVALLATAFSGCLVSGTKVFSYAIAPPALQAVGGTVNEERVDYTDDKTYQEYKDEIRQIDRVGFTIQVQENQGTNATMSMYFSETMGLGSVAAVESQATLLFLNYPIPANGLIDISYDESQKILLNFEALQELAATGAFSIYTIAGGNFNLTLNVLVFTITFTVGL